MARTRLGKRLNQLQIRMLTGCAACRSAPAIVVLLGDEPAPPDTCPVCGQPYKIRRVIRLVHEERGPR
jgi:hypothetical protein